MFIVYPVFNGYPCFAQVGNNTVVTGVVTDASTGEPLPAVTVVLENTTVGTITGQDGRYRIATFATSYKIRFSFIGYETETRTIFPGRTQVVDLQLMPSAVEINEVVVKPSHKSYHNRNNPAVALIDSVIVHKDDNRMSSMDYYTCHKYEKIDFSLSNLKKDIKWPGLFNPIRLLLTNVDSSRVDGKKNIPVYLKETRSDMYYRKKPRDEKEIIRGEKTIRIDQYVDNKGLTANIRYLYQNINIYDNNILFLSNKFLSPLAGSAPLFYRFFIEDTSLVGTTRCYRVFFEPRNPADFLFHGFLFITADSSYAIRKIDMSFNKAINIDWVNDVRIVQDFEDVDGKAWVLTRDEISVDFGISRDLPGIYGQREAWYDHFTVDDPVPDTVFSGLPKTTRLNPAATRPGYWDSVRQAPLPYAQGRLYSIVDSIRHIPAFKRRMGLVMLLTTSFMDLGKVEIGPVGTFYSFNPVEGQRVKLGGRTTYAFNNRFYLDGYLAYGFRDRQYKYDAGLTYSLSGKTIYTFPVKSVRLSYRYETETPGVNFDYASQDNFLLSFRRGVNDKLFYNRSFGLDYLNEYASHFSVGFGYRYTELTPGGALSFTPPENCRREVYPRSPVRNFRWT